MHSVPSGFMSILRHTFSNNLVSRRPTLKRGSGETVYKTFELWNVYWMKFTCYVSALFTSQHPFNQIRLQHHQTNSATLFIQQ